MGRQSATYGRRGEIWPANVPALRKVRGFPPPLDIAVGK